MLGSIARMLTLTVDGVEVRVARRRDDPRRPARARYRDPHAVLGAQPHPDQRLPGVHGRGRGLAGARAVVRAQGRGRHGGAHRLGEGAPQPSDGAGAAGVVGRPLPGQRGRPAMDARVRRRRRSATARPRRRPTTATPATRATTTPPTGRPPRPSPSPSRSTMTSTCATTPVASSATSASRPVAPTRSSPSRSPRRAGASTPASPPSRTSSYPTRHACTAATASASARPAR